MGFVVPYPKAPQIKAARKHTKYGGYRVTKTINSRVCRGDAGSTERNIVREKTSNALRLLSLTVARLVPRQGRVTRILHIDENSK